MPEGDTIHHAAARIRTVLQGRVPDEIRTPHPRHRAERWPERLDGLAVRSVDAHGKHLFVRFDGGLTLHSHLRMTGAWGVHREGARWKRAARRAWLVIRSGEWSVVQFDGPVLELTELASIGSLKVTVGCTESDTFVAPSAGFVEDTVGGVVSGAAAVVKPVPCV